MQNLPDSPINILPTLHQRSDLLKRRVESHPYVATSLLFLYFLLMWTVLHFAVGPGLARLSLSFLPREILGEVLVSLVVIAPILLLRWWSETGFTRGITRHGVIICLIPLALFLGPLLCGLPLLVGQASLMVSVLAVLLALLVGFAEEGFFRGVLLRALLPGGIWPSVLLSSLLFTCVHLTNILSGFPPYYVIGQLVLTFGTGVLFAAIRLRTGSIWPTIILHAMRDVGGLILLTTQPRLALSTPLISSVIVNGVFSLICILNAIVLLRPSQLRLLRVTYGLEPEPISAPSVPFSALPPWSLSSDQQTSFTQQPFTLSPEQHPQGPEQ